MILTRAQYLGAKKRRFKNVPLPDGIDLGDGTLTKDASVRIRSLTQGELDRYEAGTYRVSKTGEKLLIDSSALEEHRRRLLRLVLVDENDNTLLGPEDNDAVLETDGLLASNVYREACKHCGIKELDEQAQKN